MTLKRESNGIIEYEENIHIYTQEEVDLINKEDEKVEKDALKDVIADGFVRFPVFFRDKDDNLVEGFSYVSPDFTPSCAEGFSAKNGMNFNIYIPSYGRAGTAKTMAMMNEYLVENWYAVIDPSQYQEYKKHYPINHLIIRDGSFRSLDKLDIATSRLSPDTMHGTSGLYNFLLYFSRSLGETHYWTMDDDIRGVAMKARKGDSITKAGDKYDKNEYYRCSHMKNAYGFRFNKFLFSIEELTKKMRNPGFVGIEKFGLVFALPIMWKLGTRLYSFYLTSNKTRMDHYGQHNNDVITSLGMSRAGYVNLLFEGICYDSAPTQAGGGLTEVYAKFGTLDKGKVLCRTHPHYSKITNNYNRIHHSVNYTKYNKQRIVGAPIK